MSIVSFLFLVAALAGIWWLVSFAPVYWDHIAIKGDLHEAANLCMKEDNDELVRAFIVRRLATYKNLNLTPEEVRIDRQPQKWVAIDVTYSRTVKPLFLDERIVSFNRHVEQDLLPVKW